MQSAARRDRRFGLTHLLHAVIDVGVNVLNVREREGRADHVLEQRQHDVRVERLAVEQRFANQAPGEVKVLQVALVCDARVRRDLKRGVSGT